MLRAIHIFPNFPNVASIDVLRKKHDPLYNLIPPHLTLVFPFDSLITTETLKEHLQELIDGISPFFISLKGTTGSDNEYLFLNVKSGNDKIIDLHDRLYSGLLKEYLNRSITYTPHLTVGRFKDKQAFKVSQMETENFNETFSTIVNEIIVEKIDPVGNSIVEARIQLN